MPENEALLYIIEAAAKLLKENLRPKSNDERFTVTYELRAELREAMDFYRKY